MAYQTTLQGRKDDAKRAADLATAMTGVNPVSVAALGANLILTYLGEDTARKVAQGFARANYRVKVWESIEYNQINQNTVLRPSKHTVWRVGATA